MSNSERNDRSKELRIRFFSFSDMLKRSGIVLLSMLEDAGLNHSIINLQHFVFVVVDNFDVVILPLSGIGKGRLMVEYSIDHANSYISARELIISKNYRG
jgi:hypothetical protein